MKKITVLVVSGILVGAVLMLLTLVGITAAYTIKSKSVLIDYKVDHGKIIFRLTFDRELLANENWPKDLREILTSCWHGRGEKFEEGASGQIEIGRNYFGRQICRVKSYLAQPSSFRARSYQRAIKLRKPAAPGRMFAGFFN